MPSKKYYEKYKGKYAEKNKEWLYNNKDKVKAKAKRFYEKNRERILAEKSASYVDDVENKRAIAKRSREKSALNPSYHLWKRVKSRAKEKDIEFSIEPEDVIIPDNCPVLGIPLFRNLGGKGACENSPTIDRLNPSFGYIRGNIHVISYRANRLKNDGTLAEHIALVKWMQTMLKDNL